MIGDGVELMGTIRAFSRQVFQQLRERVTAVFQGTAAMYNCSADVQWSPVRAANRPACLPACPRVGDGRQQAPAGVPSMWQPLMHGCCSL